MTEEQKAATEQSDAAANSSAPSQPEPPAASTPAGADIPAAEMQPAASTKSLWIATLVIIGVFVTIWVLNFALLVGPAREKYLVPKAGADNANTNTSGPAQTQPAPGE